MEVRQAPEPDADFLHVDTVESVLGVPLFPDGIRDANGEGTIRHFAYKSVVGAVRERLEARGGAVRLEDVDATEAITCLQSDPDMRRLAAEVQSANDTLASWHSPPDMPSDADAPDTARGMFQAGAMAAHVFHAQRAPSQSSDSADSPYRDGLLTVAPPGAGKTVLQALAINYAGVGRPVSASDQRRRKAVGIMNSKWLIRQGLDSSETLQRFVTAGNREVRVGAFFQDRRNGHDEYDYLLTTPESYAVAVESGAIDQAATVRYMLDEAHRIALAPSMQRHLTEFGSGLYMYTATPAIAGGRRDLRNQFPHSQFGSLREFVEDGILSPVQLFTYRATAEQGSAERLAVGLAADYVRSGRKTLIVCQPGGKLQQARGIAKEINHLYLAGTIVPHERFNFNEHRLACAVGMFPGADTRGDLQRLRVGERLIATTVATGHEGLNIPDLDALVIIGPQGATWVVEQWLGRILRPSGRLAVASEILPHDLRQGKPLASIFGAFGLEREIITAGYYLGRRPTTEEAAPEQSHGPHLTPPLLSGLGTGTNRTIHPAHEEYSPPQEFGSQLVTGVSVREATIAPGDLAKIPPPDFRTLHNLASEGVPIEWLYNILDKLDDPDIRYVGVWEADETGQTRYQRYYSPASHKYFLDNPVPRLAGEAEFLEEEIATMLSVSPKYVQGIIARLGIEPLSRLTKYRRSARYYGMDTLIAVAREMAKIPMATETDIPLAELCAEIGDRFVSDLADNPHNGISPTLKWRHTAWGLGGAMLHVSESEADFVRSAYKELVVADKAKHISYGEVAVRAGLALSTFGKKIGELSADKRPPTLWLRSKPKVRPTEFLDRGWGEAFAEYIKPGRVLPWEATLGMVALYFGKKKNNMTSIIGRRNFEKPQRLPLPGVSEEVVYPLSVILDLRSEGMEPIPEAPQLIADLAALSPGDITNAERIAYSQNVQRHFISPEQLAPPGEIGYYLGRRLQPPTLPPVRAIELEQASEPSMPEVESVPVLGLLDLGSARKRSGCTPGAFVVLLQRVPFAAGDVESDGAGAIVGLRPSGVEAMDMFCKTISIAPVGWTSLPMVAHASGHASKEAVMAAVANLEQEYGRLMMDNEVRLARNGQEVELYFEAATRRKIRSLVLNQKTTRLSGANKGGLFNA